MAVELPGKNELRTLLIKVVDRILDDEEKEGNLIDELVNQEEFLYDRLQSLKKDFAEQQENLTEERKAEIKTTINNMKGTILQIRNDHKEAWSRFEMIRARIKTMLGMATSTIAFHRTT
jgi:polyhydroxyalkanoate synthesis regulator phasin